MPLITIEVVLIVDSSSSQEQVGLLLGNYE